MEYTIEHKLCDTQWFSVHAAIRNRDHLPVAIKFLKPGASADVKMRFVREARILDRLDHPNIVKIVDQNFSTAPNYVVTPLYEADLHEWLSRADRTDPNFERDVEAIFASLLDAVEYAHKNGTNHRDLKLKNALVNSATDVVLIDFNIASDPSASEEKLTQCGIPIGTPGCMAPEQAAGSLSIDHRVDIFQLGHILYKLVGGVLGAPTLDYESIPKKYRSIVDRCTRSRPADRYQDVSTLKKVFAAVRDENALQSEINEINSFKFACDGATDTHAMRVLELLEIYSDNQDLVDSFFMKADPCAFELLNNADATRFGSLIRNWCDFFRAEVWPFSYTDAVASRAEQLFSIASRPQPKADLLCAVIEMGNRHHRYPVWGTARAMLSLVKENEVAQATTVGLARFDMDDLDCIARDLGRYHAHVQQFLSRKTARSA